MRSTASSATPAPAPAERRSPRLSATARRRVVLGIVFVASVVAMRRPTPRSLSGTLPSNTGDPALIGWILSWDGHALFGNPLHAFDANIFWPRGLTLAYSDPLFALAPVFVLLRSLTGNFVAAMNLTMLGLMLLTLVATYLLAKRVIGRTDAAVIAAFAFTFSGFAMGHVGHPQLQTLGFLSLGFYLLLRVLEERTTGIAVACGLAGAAIATGALYFAALFGVSAAVIVIGYVARRQWAPGPGLARPLVIVVAIIGVVAAPVAIQYNRLQHEQGFEREAPPSWGLKGMDLLTPAPRSYLYDWLARVGEPRDGEHQFFPGFSVLLLGGVGVVALARGRGRTRRAAEPDPAEGRRGELPLLLAAGVTSAVLALGREAFGVPMPFAFLHDHVPGFSGIRVASRLAVVGLLALALLAGTGWAAIVRRWPARRAGAATVVVALVVLAELAAPAITARVSTSDATLAVYRELSHRPDGVVVELPMMRPLSQPFEWATVEAPRMLFSTIDWKPRVNGYSGYLPRGYAEDVEAFDTFPGPVALERAKQLHVRYVVLHVTRGQYTDADVAAMAPLLPVGVSLQHYGDAWLVDLGP